MSSDICCKDDWGVVAATLLENTTLYLNLYERSYPVGFTGYFMITERAFISGDHAPRRWEDCNLMGDWGFSQENKLGGWIVAGAA